MVTGVFPPRKYGGVTAISYITAKALKKRGHDVTVYTTDVGNNPYSRLDVPPVGNLDGVSVHYFRNLSNFIAYKHRILSPLGIIPALLKNIRNFDVIHLNGLRNIQDLSVAFFALVFGVPYAVQTHGDLPRVMTKKRLKFVYDTLFGYRLLRHASKVIGLGRFEANFYKSINIPEDRIAIIPNGIDLSEFEILPENDLFKKDLNIPKNKKIILYLSRIDKIKGLDFLVLAFDYLTKKLAFANAFLVVVGPDEGFLSEVKSLVNSLHLTDSVIFTGALHGKQKLAAFAGSDIYVLPSRYETFPMSVIEACACGKPVIASNVGGLKQLVLHGETGFLVSPEKTEDFAHYLLILLNDDSKARAMGRAGKVYANENLSIDKVAANLERIYTDLTLRKKR